MTKPPIDESKLHHKPTKEELEEGALKAAEEAEALKAQEEEEKKHGKKDDDDEEEKDPKDKKGKGDEDEDDDEEDQEGEDEEDDDEGDDEDEDDEKEEDDEKGKEEDGKKKQDPEELKKKLNESTREAQILYRRNKKVHEAIDKAAQLAEVTEDELKAEYSDWDKMSPFEQKMAKETMTLNRRLSEVTKVSEEFKNEEAWVAKVDEYLSNPATLVAHPDLDGREEEFKIFATKPTRINLDFTDLTKLFLFDLDDSRKKREKKKGKMFEDGNGGHKREKPKSDKISVEQARNLRETDYNEYRRQLKAGKIDSSSF